MYNLPIWTDKLRPAQLLREPFCRECARQGIRTRATVVDHIRPHRGDWAEASPAPAGVHARDAYGERPRPRADMVMTLPLGVENPGGAPWIPRVASNAKKFPRSGDG